MRILLLIYSIDGGGAERVTVRLASQWARMGHEVAIAVMGPSAKPSYPLHEDVEIINTAMASQSGNLIAGMIASITRIHKLRRLMKERKPDAVIAMMSTAAILLGLAGRRRGTVRIGSERVYPPFDPIPSVWRALRPIGYSLLDGMVVQTNGTRDWMRQNTWQRKLAVIANPVEVPADGAGSPALAAPFGFPEGVRLLLAMGRLEEQKGFDDLITAFAEAGRMRHDWHLAIVGSGSRRRDLEAWASATGLGDRIHFPGLSADPDGWFRRADLFVLSSRFEGFPNVLLEAMAHGLACVACDCPTGPSDIIDDGKNGVLVEAGSTTRLADAMSKLMDDLGERIRLGENARGVLDAYRIDSIATQWLDFVGELRS